MLDTLDAPSAAATTFASNTRDHVMVALHEHEQYRHIRFHERTGHPFGWIDLITAPRTLTITGGMGTYVFRIDEDDILGFFARMGTPSLRYLSEKVIAADRVDGVRSFSTERWRQKVTEHVAATTADRTADERATIQHAVEQHVLNSEDHGTDYEAGANLAVIEFDGILGWQFGPSLDRDWEDWSFRFEYACYAAIWGAKRYLHQG